MNPDTLRALISYAPKDLQEEGFAHADAWEADLIAWCDTTVERDALRRQLEKAWERLEQRQSELDRMCIHARNVERRLEAAERALRMVAGSNDCVCANRYDHGPMCDCVGDVVRASLPPSESGK